MSSTFAWDEVGHKITAQIAWQRMSPEVRDKVFQILLKAPEDSHLSVFYDAFNARSEAIKRRELFLFASKWSDFIRNRSFKIRNKKYNNSNWHYGSIFWSQKNGKSAILKNFKGAGGLAIAKLHDFEKILRDPKKNDDEKAIALAWFLHLGGDIHNPLHNASRVTETEKTGDQGGNLFVFRQRTKTQRGLNLHGFWDSIIRNGVKRKKDAWDTNYITPIAKKIVKKFPFSKMKNRLKLSEYESWNMEGYKLLAEKVYTSEITRNQIPSKKYRKKAFKIAQEQLALAGYRLGETLNQIFGNKLETALNAPANCKIIRKVLYPVSKRRTPDQTLRIALLDICPPNKGMVARPLTTLFIDGEPINYEYEVKRVFKTKEEANKYVKKYKIKDKSF